LEKLNILVSNLGNYYQNNQEYLFRCPKCEHPKRKLSVNLEKGLFKCWVCSYSGKSIGKMLKDYFPYAEYSKWSEVSSEIDLSKYEEIFQEHQNVDSREEVTLPRHYKSLSAKYKKEFIKPLTYLQNRGLTTADILQWKVGFCDYGEYAGRIIVPSFDAQGALSYYIGRSYYENSYKYKNPKHSKDVIFNDILLDWKSDLVLVEGVFDAIKAKNAVPLLGSTLKEGSRLFKKIVLHRPDVYLALDPDADDKAYEISALLGQYGINTFKVDISGFADVGEMTKKEFLNRKSNASFIASGDYLMYKLNF